MTTVKNNTATGGRNAGRVTVEQQLEAVRSQRNRYFDQRNTWARRYREAVVALSSLIGKIEEMHGCMEVNYDEGNEECYPEFNTARAVIAEYDRLNPLTPRGQEVRKAMTERDVRENKTPEFTPITGSDVPKYRQGEITKAYLMRDGSIVGHCPSTHEWLKWNQKGQLNSSLGHTRKKAAALGVNDGTQWIEPVK